MKADLSSIFSSIVVFSIFLFGIFTIKYIIESSYNNLYTIGLSISERYYEKSRELIIFKNNLSNYENPYIIIQNKGNKPEDLNCYKLYVNGILTNFYYNISKLYPVDLLLPGEEAIIYFENSSIRKDSWNFVQLISCSGTKFLTLIYIS